MEVPNYLQSTAYGQRFQHIQKKARAISISSSSASAADDTMNGSSTITTTSSGGLRATNVAKSLPQRIYNKSTVRNGSSGSTGSLMTTQVRHQLNVPVGPVAPSTVPIFRDDPKPISQTYGSYYGDVEDDGQSPSDGLLFGADGSIFGGGNNNISKKGETFTKLVLPSQEVLPELPRRWVKHEGDMSIELSGDGTGVNYIVDAKNNIQEARALKTDHAVPTLCGVFYYEVDIAVCSRDLLLSIGFCTDQADLKRLPGLEQHSWGYHSDDGKAGACQKPGSDYGPVFGRNDIIGCGIDFTTRSIFYTKNGIHLGVAFHDLELVDSKTKEQRKFYPSLGFKPSIGLRTNFGADEFLYNINQYVQERKQALLETITKSEPKSVLLEDSDESTPKDADLVRSLISSYFSYMGYLETGKAFEQEAANGKLARAGQMVDVDEEDHKMADKDEEERADNQDMEVVNRQQIGHLITEGNITLALKHLKSFYPQVIEDPSSLLVFKLECCKFVELVRATIPEEASTNSTQDVEMTDIDSSTNELNATATTAGGGGGASTFDRTTALSEAVVCGQQIRVRYKDDMRPYVRKRLPLVFSLLAYDDPREDQSVAFLLNADQRVGLAEEVNAQILVSQGKAPIPALQRVAQHTMGLVWELQSTGRLESNVLNIQQDFL